MVAIAGIVAGDKFTEDSDAATAWAPEISAKTPAPRVTIFPFGRPEEQSSGNRNDSKELMVDRIRSAFLTQDLMARINAAIVLRDVLAQLNT